MHENEQHREKTRRNSSGSERRPHWQISFLPQAFGVSDFSSFSPLNLEPPTQSRRSPLGPLQGPLSARHVADDDVASATSSNAEVNKRPSSMMKSKSRGLTPAHEPATERTRS